MHFYTYAISALKKTIYQRLLSLNKAGQPLTASELSDLPVPAPFKTFLQKALSRQIDRELSPIQMPASEWFDDSTDSFRRASSELFEAARTSAHFPASEVESYLRRTTDVVTDYIVNPVETILHFGFPPDAESAPKSDLSRRLSYFDVYPELLRVVSDIPSDTVSKSELQARLIEQHETYWDGLSAEEWMEQLRPVCQLLGFVGDNRMPVGALIRFTEKRGDKKIVESLQASDAAGTVTVSVEELFELIETALRPPPPPPVAEPEPFPSTADETPAAQLPLWKQYSGAQPTQETPASTGSPKPLWKTYAPESEIKTPHFAEKERIVLGTTSDLRNTFVRELFHGDQEAYGRVIEQLSKSKTWSDSATILKNDVFVANRIDIYSEPAIAFTNAVEEHVKQFSR